MMIPWKFRDDICSGSRVIALTDRQANTQTYITENNATLAACVDDLISLYRLRGLKRVSFTHI